jgi:hypothetical protein
MLESVNVPKMCRIVVVAVVLGIVVLDGSTVGDEPRQSDVDSELTAKAQAIIARRCYACHGAQQQESDFRLDKREVALAGGDQGVSILPGNVKESSFLRRIVATDDDRMPPTGERLSSSEVDVLRRWIDAGAAWPAKHSVEQHWAWQTLTPVKIPRVSDPHWPANAIDHFLLSRMEKRHIKPSPIAARPVLIRRAYLDVIGMPPAPSEWQRWMDATNADWYARMIDELLASPHYGEKWGRFWLDQARYADSDGYEKDRPRPQAFLYRDWVINALNSDLAFDDFSTQQIAGDLLPDASPNVVLGTGFHRNTLTNNEGGIDREEDRVKQTVDRLNTTFSVWLGLTVQCAQCHTHKYDPISHEEYFQLYAFFNDADETQIRLEPTVSQRASFEVAKHRQAALLKSKRQVLAELKRGLVTQQLENEKKLKERYPEGRPTTPSDGLVGHYPFDKPGTPDAAQPDTAQPDERRGDESRHVTRFFGPGELQRVAGTVSPKDGNDNESGAIRLDGSGQHLELPGVPGFRSNQPFSGAVWIYPTDNLGAILTKIDEPNDFRGIDFTNNRGLLEIHLVDKWPVNAIKVTPTTARLTVGKWQHVAFTYDGSQKAAGVSIFIDGKDVEVKVYFDNLTGDFTTSDPWRVGRRKGGTFLEGALDDLRVYDRALTSAEVSLIAGDHQNVTNALQIVAIPPDERTVEQSAKLLEYFVSASPKASALQGELNSLEANPPQLARHTGLVLGERAEPRDTYVHLRGEFLNKGPQVDVGTPDFLPEIVARGDRLDRLDLAKWMFGPNRHLVSRVYVNRVWQNYFGRALVISDSDFGTQGELPSHPELLDWLALTFVDNDWQVKVLHRQILMSKAYRQASLARPNIADADPENALYARQNRIRVSAESVRDLALSASGRLDRRLNGPSVFPPLPSGVIELAFVDVINRGPWRESEGGDRYRRGVYTFFQRTSPYPLFTLFDAPDSNVACTRRETSNTPLQALTLWNDPVFMETAQMLALRLLESPADDRDSRFEHLFVICLARKPALREVEVLEEVYARSHTIYEADEDLANQVVRGLTIPSGVTDAEFGAWASVARVVINLDEFITRQ